MNKREKLAREMAEKSGYDYDKSGKMMQNAWLHNADVEINRTPEVQISAKVVIEDGVKVAEGTELKVEHIQATIDNIKDGLERDANKPPEAAINAGTVTAEIVGARETLPEEDDGDVTSKPSKEAAVDPLDGADAGAVSAETPREPKPGEYLCSKCNTPHRKNSNIGKKHLKR